ncbi:rhamnan synthesis F family protein [Loktanella atrilutea]|uniref:rhamnan synthesis F family protein n=1 Tax=Loktanella atrilutea TaxID=366533 RepID=UPI0009321920|nr:rhamnan synthesis F family protein [Loktanella atrilutea]
MTPLPEAIAQAGLFDARWYAAGHPDVTLTGLAPEAHFARFGLPLGRWPCPDLPTRLAGLDGDLHARLAKAYGLDTPPAATLRDESKQGSQQGPAGFDTAFYLQANPHIDHRNWRPCDHFMQVGWKDGRRPNPDFDVVWYEQTHGHTYDAATVNPLLHYRKTGAALGLATMPPRPVRLDPATARPLPPTPRRACLFAGWDPAGRIDATVLRYLTELARHADVFYLADCDMIPAELAQLDGIVQGAWARRHGAYDMGSYSLLARDLIGWDRLSTYDEVLLVNDSCYLVQPLDATLAMMRDRPCAWWGMQATKGMAGARALQPFPASERLSMAEIRGGLIDHFEDDPTYDFHIGSYFLALRRDIIADPRFRRVLDAVRPVRNKRVIVRRYEVGLTRFLIGLGYAFDTAVDHVTRDHPVYSAVAFDLLENGFPLLKRFLMAANPFGITATAYWEAQLPRLGSVTPVAEIAAHLMRVVPPETLVLNRQIMEHGAAPRLPLSEADFVALDAGTPTYDHYWAFVAAAGDGRLTDDAARVLAAVADDPQRVKVILTRGRAIPQDGHAIVSLPLRSLAGQQMLARCRTVFVRGANGADLGWPLDPGLHDVIAQVPRPGAPSRPAPRTLLAEIAARATGSALLAGYVRPDTKTPRSVVFLYDPRAMARNRARLFARLDGLQRRGWTCVAMDIDHVARDVLTRVEAVCFIGLSAPLDRPPAEAAAATLHRRDLIEAVRGTGGLVVCDIDSPVAVWPVFAGSPQVQDDPLRANALAWHSAETAALLDLTDAVTVATPELARIMAGLLHPSQSIHVLPGSLPADAMTVRPRPARSRLHLCCAAGTALAARDLAVCLPGLGAALADHPDAVLHLVDAKETALDLPADRVRCYRPMPDRARQTFLAGMDLNLMPLEATAYNAACPATPILEAACQGVPTLGTDLSALRVMIDDGVTGYLVPDPQDWADRLRDLLRDPAALRRIGAAAQQAITAAHDPDRTAAQLSDIFDALLKETRNVG